MKPPVKYSQAPISEVICGLTFSNNIFERNHAIYDIISYLKQEYPVLETVQPLADEFLEDYRLLTSISSQEGPFLQRLRKQDNKWLAQIQFNKLYYNWIRRDNQSVGEYPGFTYIFNEFKKILEKTVSYTGVSVSGIHSQIKHYSLLYQDRVMWQDHIDDLAKIDKILKISIPSISYATNNLFSRYTLPLSEIDGYADLRINTAASTIEQNRQMLIIQVEIKSKAERFEIDEWFNKAHELQIDFFEQIFQPNILSQWK